MRAACTRMWVPAPGEREFEKQRRRTSPISMFPVLATTRVQGTTRVQAQSLRFPSI